MSSQHERWLVECARLAAENVIKNNGQPYAALVVRDGQILGRGVNSVDTTGDPTAHAEIEAIREACKALGTTDLSDCLIYASGEPCPMCMATIYWVGAKAVYFAYSKEQASQVGLGTSIEIYRQLSLPPAERSIPAYHLPVPDGVSNPLQLWRQRQMK